MPHTEITEHDEPEPQPAVDPGLQKMVVLFGMAVFSAVVGTALYGTKEQSERAFRLLPWLRRKPEPEADERPAEQAERR